MSRSDTIVALSSGALPSGVAVIRLSGQAVPTVLSTLCPRIPEPRMATLLDIRDRDEQRLDRGLVLFFPAPASFTGEDCAELQIHGGKAVVAAVLREICSFDDCRLADAGEFMRRAFLNGKTDLLQSEAVADLIAAETEAQRRFATRNADGRHRALYSEWRQRIIHLRAMLEVGLDFADEGDVDESVGSDNGIVIAALIDEIDRHLAGHHKVEILRDGLDVVIMGPPNSGKSSLINALTTRDVAIVSDEAGTTRDLIEVALDLDGHKVRITDSAGLRDTASGVEQMGIARARGRAEAADLVLWLVDGSQPMKAIPADLTREHLTILSKSDLAADHAADHDLAISTVTGEGLDALKARLAETAVQRSAQATDIVPWRQRHIDLLSTTKAELERALIEDRAELAAEHFRLASDALGRISGEIDIEDLLDVIFSQFCIGK